MKKSLIFTTALSTLVLSLTGCAIINSVNAETADDNKTLLAVDTELKVKSKTNLDSKNETVYAITNADGSVNKTFIGNTIYDGSDTLPVDFKISYFLDGTEISASDLAGKSGHVKIVLDFNALKTYQDKYVPFLAISGLTLDETKFSNVSATNAKIADQDNKIMIIGYAFPGLDANLGTDFLSHEITVEADTTDFEISEIYSLLTNEIFTEIDTSKLSSIDELVNSVNQLSSGLDEIISGTSTLSDGLNSAIDGISKLAAGANELKTGADTLAAGTSALYAGTTELESGLNAIVSNNATINGGVNMLINDTLSKVNAAIKAYDNTYEVNLNNYNVVLPAIISVLPDGESKTALTSAKQALDLYTGILQYTAGVAAARDGAATINANMAALSSGAATLAEGATTLDNGFGTLVSGTTELYNGSVTLKDGLNTFKTSGIDKLVNFANQDAASFVYNFRQTVSAAKSYTTHTKFIFKTPSIK